MKFKILALHDGELLEVIPLEDDGYALPSEYGEKTEAQEVYNRVNKFSVPKINPTATFEKGNLSLTILELL